MQPSDKQVEDLMLRLGYEEEEARAAYHLRSAQELFDELYAGETGKTMGRTAASIFRMTYVDNHFHALQNLLARRVLSRDYPDGWGNRPDDGEEEKTDNL